MIATVGRAARCVRGPGRHSAESASCLARRRHRPRDDGPRLAPTRSEGEQPWECSRPARAGAPRPVPRRAGRCRRCERALPRRFEAVGGGPGLGIGLARRLPVVGRTLATTGPRSRRPWRAARHVAPVSRRRPGLRRHLGARVGLERGHPGLPPPAVLRGPADRARQPRARAQPALRALPRTTTTTVRSTPRPWSCASCRRPIPATTAATTPTAWSHSMRLARARRGRAHRLRRRRDHRPRGQHRVVVASSSATSDWATGSGAAAHDASAAPASHQPTRACGSRACPATDAGRRAAARRARPLTHARRCSLIVGR